MNQILYSKNMRKTKIILAIILVVVIAVVGFFSMGIVNANSKKILKGVSINAIDLSGKTTEEAENILNEYQEGLNSKKYLLSFGNREIEVSGEDINLIYEKDLVNQAYTYGRDGNIFENSITAWKSLFNDKYEISPEFVLSGEKLDEKIAILLEEEQSTAVADKYEISGDKIIIVKGHDGVVANTSSIKEKIIENAGTADSEVKIQIDTHIEYADRVDFEELFAEIYVEKKDATYNQKEDGSVEYLKEIIGVSFDKNAAETEYLNLNKDEKMIIKLDKEKPSITTANLESVLFGDVLASYKTTYNASNKDRSTNLEVAAKNINDTILLPGEEFSYNKEVGQRTYANGFKDAHIFAGGKVVDGLGGGICQISSTLYNAILMVDGIEITERKNHMMYPQYVKQSLDATVVWGSIDFRFKNTRETPIKIVATVKNGVATTTIYGKKAENEPIIELESVIEETYKYTTVTEYDDTMYEGETVVIQDPVNGYRSKAYKIVKDENGKQLSRTLISTDTYKQTSKIVKVGTKKPEVIQPVEPTTPSETPENSNQNQENTNNGNGNNTVDLPSGWDSPENPYYTGNN